MSRSHPARSTIPRDLLHTNNFDLLRLVLAGMVALVHVAILSGEPSLAWMPVVVSSDLAVRAFFVASGFLVVMSYERATSVWDYAERRVRRIYPAYAVVILGAAAVLALLSTARPADYFSSTWVQYVGANLAFLNFLQPTLPGVFEANLQPTVNGALWTLKIEVAFYVLVPLIVASCRRVGWLRTLGAAYAVSVLYRLVATELAADDQSLRVWVHQLPSQLAFFAAGAAGLYAFPVIRPLLGPLGVAGALALGLGRFLPSMAVVVLEPVSIAAVVLAVAFGPFAGPVGKYGDFSYGLYILHFPVIQSIVTLGWFRGQPWLTLAASLGASVAGAVLLWHLVERRWLLASSHYRHRVRE